jgi:hypothetical protein
MYGCMYVWVYVCMYVRMYVWMYVCMCLDAVESKAPRMLSTIRVSKGVSCAVVPSSLACGNSEA